MMPNILNKFVVKERDSYVFVCNQGIFATCGSLDQQWKPPPHILNANTNTISIFNRNYDSIWWNYTTGNFSGKAKPKNGVNREFFVFTYWQTFYQFIISRRFCNPIYYHEKNVYQAKATSLRNGCSVLLFSVLTIHLFTPSDVKD